MDLLRVQKAYAKVKAPIVKGIYFAFELIKHLGGERVDLKASLRRKYFSLIRAACVKAGKLYL